uniref:hypothetical protein n=1 Tax=Cyanothece sp. BG0011 TaxID=2082950 RepID=UPI0030D6E4F6
MANHATIFNSNNSLHNKYKTKQEMILNIAERLLVTVTELPNKLTHNLTSKKYKGGNCASSLANP